MRCVRDERALRLDEAFEACRHVVESIRKFLQFGRCVGD